MRENQVDYVKRSRFCGGNGNAMLGPTGGKLGATRGHETRVSDDSLRFSALSRYRMPGRTPEAALKDRLIFLGSLGALMCALVAFLTLTGAAPYGQRPFIAFGHVLTVAVPIAAGLYFWYRQPE